MPRTSPRQLVFALACLAALACGTPDVPPDFVTDAGETDTGEADAGETDAGEADAGEADAGETDAGETDAGEEVPSDSYADVCRDSVVASPKGTYLAYETCAGTENDGTYLQTVATGARTFVTGATGDELLFSADEALLYIRGTQGLFVTPTASVDVKVLQGDAPWAGWVLLTADGGKVVWASGRKTISVQAADGSGTPTVLHQWGASDPVLSNYPEGRLLTPDGTRLVFGSEGSMAPYYVVPLDASSPAKQIGTRDLQIYPDSLSNTHLVATAKGAAGAFSLEDMDLATGTGTVLETVFPQSPHARGDRMFFGKNYKDIYTWKRGDAAPTLVANEGGGHFFVNPDGERAFWLRANTLAARPADGSTATVDVLNHGGVVGSYFGFAPDADHIVMLTAGGGSHGIQLGDLASADSGLVVEPTGASKIGTTVAFNSTGTHVLYFTREDGSEDNILRSAPVSTRTPVTLATGVWRWHPIPGSSKVFFYTDVGEITDVVSTLHVIEP